MRTLFLATCVLLGACAAPPTKLIVQDVLITPDAQQMADCAVEPPPDSPSYLSAAAIEKENMLYVFAVTELDNLNKCNQQWKSLREWVDSQRKLYSTAQGALP